MQEDLLLEFTMLPYLAAAIILVGLPIIQRNRTPT